MESLKLKNNQYWDATGVFDHTSLKTQDVLNAEFGEGIQENKTKVS